MQQCVTLYLASLINMYRLDFSKSGEQLAAISSIVILILCVGLPFFMLEIVMQRSRGQIKLHEYEETYGTITEGIRLTSFWCYTWNIIGVFRWLITLTILVTLVEVPCV